MSEEIFDIIPDFDSLLNNKSFTELTLNEQHLVLHYMSAEDYNNRHFILQNAKQMLKDELLRTKPDSKLKNRLLQRLTTNKSDSTVRFTSLINFWNYRIPLYQSVVIIGFVIFIISRFGDFSLFPPAITTERDTVYIEKTIPVITKETSEVKEDIHKDVQKNKTPNKLKKSKIEYSKEIPKILTDQNRVILANILENNRVQKRGVTIDKESNLYKGLVAMQ